MIMRLSCLRLASVLVVLSFAPSPLVGELPTALAAGATWYVNDGPSGNDSNSCLSASAPCLTVSSALARAPSGATIMVAPNLYPGGLVITQNVTLIGSGIGLTTIEGGGPVITISPSITVALRGLTISGGTASDGGGIENGTGTVIGRNVAITGNSGTYGGGIYNCGTITLSNSTVSNNTGAMGGGIYASCGTVNLVNSTVSANTSTTVGGGILDYGVLNVTNSTISGNSAARGGGGVHGFQETMTITNTTISKNSGQLGGGVYNESGTVTLTNDTISGNTGAAGGVYNAFGTASLSNTVVAGNIGGGSPDCGINLSDGSGGHGYNFIGDGTNCGLTDGTNGDHVGTSSAPLDAKLASLAPNGGPTMTMMPQAGSPLISAGYAPTCLSAGSQGISNKDQRSYPRKAAAAPTGRGVCDIGAYDTEGTGR